MPSSGDYVVIAQTTRRGFTFHEELDNIGLVHMNGRVYDPNVARLAIKYQLVLQSPAASLGDYDRMIAIETLIEDSLAGDGEVDGHDAGSGEVNIFVHTDAPERAFDRIRPVLVAENASRDARVAYRTRAVLPTKFSGRRA